MMRAWVIDLLLTLARMLLSAAEVLIRKPRRDVTAT